MKYRFINLSVHPVVFCDKAGSEVFTVPTSNQVGKLTEEVSGSDSIEIEQDGKCYKVEVFKKKLTGSDLPEPEDGVIYLTSTVIASMANRKDVMAPHEKVRDSNGNVIGRLSLADFT